MSRISGSCSSSKSSYSSTTTTTTSSSYSRCSIHTIPILLLLLLVVICMVRSFQHTTQCLIEQCEINPSHSSSTITTTSSISSIIYITTTTTITTTTIYLFSTQIQNITKTHLCYYHRLSFYIRNILCALYRVRIKSYR